uniref:Dystrotelin n=1 Tax=Pogona vitticeps TaxID=103695 RepID=A0ABM5FAZ2_9SAUR
MLVSYRKAAFHHCPPVSTFKKMDLDQQEVLNAIENSVYRTALKLCAVQSVCQLDVTDTSSIQHILPKHRCQAEKLNLLPVGRLFKLLKELFQRARLEKPGQVDPRAPELTLGLLTAAYDRNSVGFVQPQSTAAALIALSGDSLLTKYKAFFQLYATCTGKGSKHSLCVTRNGVRSLLTDLLQLLTVVGENRDPSNVELATRSCFNGVLSSAIGEERFLAWLQSEPALLCWLPTCYRLSATKMVTHWVQCNICKRFPITGLRYRCLKCLDFDLCQVCFLTGQYCKPHKKSHPVIEHCVPVSAKENAKLFFHIIRNNLQPGRCKRKEALRRKALVVLRGGGDAAVHSQTLPCPVQSISSGQPMPPDLFCSAHTVGPQPSSTLDTKVSQTPEMENNSRSLSQDKTHQQVLAALKDELAKAQQSVKTLHQERRYLKKQLNKWKDKVQVLRSAQEEKNCTLEKKLHELRASQENLKMELQQMRIEIKNMTLRKNRPLQEKNVHNGSSCPPLQPKHLKYLRQKSWALSSSGCARKWLPKPQASLLASSSRSPEIVQQAECFRDANLEHTHPENSKEVNVPLANHPEKLEPETNGDHLSRRTEIAKSHSSVATEALLGKTQAEEEELQQLMMKLKDALLFQGQPDHPSVLKEELLSKAKHVSKAFSHLIGQVTLPT